jgi:hypothetical protein
MSLRFFHLVFVTLATLLCFAFAAWLYENYRVEGGSAGLAGAVVAVLGGVAMLVYGVRFYKKSKKIIL